MTDKPIEPFPEDYHNYVFKEGGLLGDFDNMYRFSKTIPWEQDRRCEQWHAQVGLLMIAEHAPYDEILEIGCGLGYIASKLARFSPNPVDAFDISPEAIRKARSLHHGIPFYVDDICQPAFRPKKQYGLVVLRDVFWYVFDHLETVIKNINACVKLGGYLFIGQSFPRLDKPFVGKEIFPNPDALRNRFSNYEPIDSALLYKHLLTEDGPIFNLFAKRVG